MLAATRIRAAFRSSGTWGEHRRFLGSLLSHEVFWWLTVLVLIFYVLFVERRPLILHRFPQVTFLGRPAGFPHRHLMVVGIVVICSYVFPALHLQMNSREMSKLAAMPFWYRFLLVTRAAVAEEILFRGYPIERTEELTGSRFLAGFLSWAAFTIAHLSSWGWAQLIIAGFGGILLTALYLWRRNLWANMIAHWLADGAGFLLPH